MTDEEIWTAIERCETMLSEIAQILNTIKLARPPELQPEPGIPGTPLSGRPSHRIPGWNVDKVNIDTGLALADQFGYSSTDHRMVVQYALQRHARGEEEDAQKTALSGGISLTAWYAILAAAIVTPEEPAAQGGTS
jgi:hypothetical protein